MYLEQTKSQGKYTCYLLRETYRQDGKVKHRTIANLSRCSPQEIQAIRLALRHKDELTEQLSLPSRQIDLRQGLSVGGVWLLYDLARQLGIVQALGPSRQGKLALWQVIARVLDQGSRLSAVRLAGRHAACDILGLDRFQEEDLYANLDWLAQLESLDGCYALKTDLSYAQADKETIHSRYRDLSLVEQAFRTSKTVELEMRPIHVRLARRTRGHALVVMLGYRLVQELAKRWSTLNLTVQEGLDELSSLCATEVLLQGSVRYKKIPTPRASVAELLRLADVKLPEVLPSRGVTVATRKKLPENRPKHSKQST
jgi:hypothetical protein